MSNLEVVEVVAAGVTVAMIVQEGMMEEAQTVVAPVVRVVAVGVEVIDSLFKDQPHKILKPTLDMISKTLYFYRCMEICYAHHGEEMVVERIHTRYNQTSYVTTNTQLFCDTLYRNYWDTKRTNIVNLYQHYYITLKSIQIPLDNDSQWEKTKVLFSETRPNAKP